MVDSSVGPHWTGTAEQAWTSELPHSQHWKRSWSQHGRSSHCPVHTTPDLFVLFSVLLAAAKHFLAQQLFITLLSTSIPTESFSSGSAYTPITSHLLWCCISCLFIWFLLIRRKQTLSRVKQTLLRRLRTALLLLCSGRAGRISSARAAQETSAGRKYPLDIVLGSRLVRWASWQDGFYSEQQEHHRGRGMERLASFSSKCHKMRFGRCVLLIKDISSHLGERDKKTAIFGPLGCF